MLARKAVGDSGTTQQVIQTHRSRGYRFIAPFAVRAGKERKHAPLLEPLPALYDAITPNASRRLVQMILGSRPCVPQQEQAIISRAGDNPLWADELTRWVAETATEHAAILLPDSMADVVLARLEQLPPSAKQVVQTASVIGREFTFRILRQVWDDEEQLDAALLELESRAL